MVENKKPKGKTFVIVGSILLMAAGVSFAEFGVFLSNNLQVLTGIVFLFTAINLATNAGKQKSGKKLLVSSLVWCALFIVLLLVFVLYAIFFTLDKAEDFTVLLLALIPLFFTLIGTFLVRLGGKLNINSPELVPAPAPKKNIGVAFVNQNGQAIPVYMPGDAPNAGFAVLGFFLPVVGLILFLMWKDQTPLKAKSCGKGALIGFIFNLALSGLAVAIPYLLF